MSPPYLLSRLRRPAGTAVSLVSLLAALPATADVITVFAAASLSSAMAEIEEHFEKETGHDLVVSLAGTSILARQIQQGAPADIFISANPDWMDILQGDGLLEAGTRFDLLGNSIVLVAHGMGAMPVEISSEMDLPGLLAGKRLAMALVDAVPAGIYGKAALESLGLWEDVETQVAQADNVRAALMLVATGEAPLGIVYATDAVAEPGLTVLGTFPADSHPQIVYPVADLSNRDFPAEAEFLAYLRSPEARRTFESQGFLVIAE